MTEVTIHAAKTHLSRLIRQACEGEEVIIARNGHPVVRLVPLQPALGGRRFGSMRGRARVDESFFESLPAEELEAWQQ